MSVNLTTWELQFIINALFILLLTFIQLETYLLDRRIDKALKMLTTTRNEEHKP